MHTCVCTHAATVHTFGESEVNFLGLLSLPTLFPETVSLTAPAPGNLPVSAQPALGQYTAHCC